MNVTKISPLLLTSTLVSFATFADGSGTTDDPFSFYQTIENRPLSTIHETDFDAFFKVEVFHIEDDNFTFGRYNGLYEEGVNVALSGAYSNWQFDSELADYWQVSASGLGLDTSRFSAAMGSVQDYELAFDYSSIYYAKNNTGKTPYQRDNNGLSLPSDWVAGNTTSEMAALNNSLNTFEHYLEREKLKLSYQDELPEQWSMSSYYSYETKEGIQARGAAFYANAQNGHAAILPTPVDYVTHEFGAQVGYQGDDYNIISSYLYSKFENEESEVNWQHPFNSNLGPGTQYPDAFGRLAVEPGNDLHQIRVVGNYSPTYSLRLSGDLAYAIAEQNEAFLPYTSNAQLAQIPLAFSAFDGEVETTTAKFKVYFVVNNKLTVQAFSRYQDRSNISVRNRYQTAFGDSWAPTDPKYAVYNRLYSRELWLTSVKATIKLPAANKLDFSYGYEEIDRYNHAVETTEEDQFKLVWRSNTIPKLSSRLSIEFKQRELTDYLWQQSYFALFDEQLINETPDNQRYTNHPLMRQYYLADREQISAKWALSYPVTETWHLGANASYQENDFEETYIGLTEDKLIHGSFNTSWYPDEWFQINAYASFDYYESEQVGRAFRGGMEKDPFDFVWPLAQASDPARDWQLAPEDLTTSVGVNAKWIAIKDELEFSLDYQWTDSLSEFHEYQTGGASDLDGLPLDDVENNEHRLTLSAIYHARPDLTFDIDYIYYRYDSEDWAYDNLTLASIDKVLTSALVMPDDTMHSFGVSVTYRFE